jgi:cellulose synthase/poly-beta-1,6-N-acetylglucosamine synthase-like glycosyltransferase
MNVRKCGYRVLYDPEAVATDVAPNTIAGEFARRVRLAMGSFRAFWDLTRVPLDISTRLAFYSHKVLRWTVPWFLIVLLVSNLVLANRPFYKIVLLFQLAFYLWAGLGFSFPRTRAPVPICLTWLFLISDELGLSCGLCSISGQHREGYLAAERVVRIQQPGCKDA